MQFDFAWPFVDSTNVTVFYEELELAELVVVQVHVRSLAQEAVAKATTAIANNDFFMVDFFINIIKILKPKKGHMANRRTYEIISRTSIRGFQKCLKRQIITER